ncbi:MAG: hypothetical protein AAGE94_21370 [Acidobacteriota bacterium]
MGTFHQNKHELHGITVVVDTDGDELFVGRLDDMDDARVILLDVDIHRTGDEPPRDEYLKRAAQWGVFAKHRQLVLDRAKVTEVKRLGDL